MEYFVRVELVETTETGRKPDYVKLHDAMRKAGFTRLIRKTNKMLSMPDGCYGQIGVVQASQVLADAERAAYSVWPQLNKIIVVECRHLVSANLKPATVAEVNLSSAKGAIDEA